MEPTNMKSNHILLPGHTKQNVIIGRHTQARRLVDSVLAKQGKERWLAVRQLWFMTDPQAVQDDRDAQNEAKQVRSSLFDPKFGRSRQTLGIAYGEAGNKNTNRRIIA